MTPATVVRARLAEPGVEPASNSYDVALPPVAGGSHDNVTTPPLTPAANCRGTPGGVATSGGVLNAATVATVSLSLRALSWSELPVATPTPAGSRTTALEKFMRRDVADPLA